MVLKFWYRHDDFALHSVGVKKNSDKFRKKEIYYPEEPWYPILYTEVVWVEKKTEGRPSRSYQALTKLYWKFRVVVPRIDSIDSTLGVICDLYFSLAAPFTHSVNYEASQVRILAAWDRRQQLGREHLSSFLFSVTAFSKSRFFPSFPSLSFSFAGGMRWHFFSVPS